MNKENIEKVSVILAQLLVENSKELSHEDAIMVGKNIIKFINKWAGNDSLVPLSDFEQHNKDCRFECYCCGRCEEIKLNEDTEPTIKDENIVAILKILHKNSED